MLHAARQLPSWLIFDVSQKMRFTFLALLILALNVPAVAKELFAARCVPALTKGEFACRIEESRCGLLVRYSDPKKKFSSEIRGVEASALRVKIGALRLSKADVESLRSREIRTADGRILLRPFDGVTYHFVMPSSGVILIDNPAFDLEHQPSLEEAVRLREVLELLERLTRIAKSEKTG
jgi:hypothetical protein